VDPRFTRTSAVADLFCQIRAGTDIAFLGGVIRYAIENNRIAKDYLVNFTNAAFIIKPGFQLPGDTDGVFSGFGVAGKSRLRSLAAKPQLCLSASEEALQSLHARDGRAHHRDSQRTIPQSR
jgi:anaerobic selenocysteine-containing dehydrogenase